MISRNLTHQWSFYWEHEPASGLAICDRAIELILKSKPQKIKVSASKTRPKGKGWRKVTPIWHGEGEYLEVSILGQKFGMMRDETRFLLANNMLVSRQSTPFYILVEKLDS